MGLASVELRNATPDADRAVLAVLGASAFDRAAALVRAVVSRRRQRCFPPAWQCCWCSTCRHLPRCTKPIENRNGWLTSVLHVVPLGVVMVAADRSLSDTPGAFLRCVAIR